MKRLARLCAPLCAALLISPAMTAQKAHASGLPEGPLAELTLLPGWRKAGEEGHMAGLHIRMPHGWHTYWRSPGDAGVPPRFNWTGSQGIKGVAVGWPVPQVFDLDGVRTLGYEDEVLLPLRIVTKGAGRATLNVTADLGVCKDICVPVTVSARIELPEKGKRDMRVLTAMADRPEPGGKAGLRSAVCKLRPIEDGMEIEARLTLPRTGQSEIGVIESLNPMHWVSEPRVERKGADLVLSAQVYHVEGKPLVMDRQGLRFTVLGNQRSVDIRGCKAPGD